ncbi:hypothetical protein PSDVSF_34180 [Pseudodesulfovibrio sediminis]|uniref:Uncharacterized protein n=1 Tax=Pseudodesulfovibrio sediminis TaxID=2810563 RepID=A0ABM7PAR7_9BACT|nr:hypothetical protein PSDVSF_34180 [Pseudodesulfovibrio sediminis]
MSRNTLKATKKMTNDRLPWAWVIPQASTIRGSAGRYMSVDKGGNAASNDSRIKVGMNQDSVVSVKDESAMFYEYSPKVNKAYRAKKV